MTRPHTDKKCMLYICMYQESSPINFTISLSFLLDSAMLFCEGSAYDGQVLVFMYSTMSVWLYGHRNRSQFMDRCRPCRRFQIETTGSLISLHFERNIAASWQMLSFSPSYTLGPSVMPLMNYFSKRSLVTENCSNHCSKKEESV